MHTFIQIKDLRTMSKDSKKFLKKEIGLRLDTKLSKPFVRTLEQRSLTKESWPKTYRKELL
jgi:hypothetical protein